MAEEEEQMACAIDEDRVHSATRDPVEENYQNALRRSKEKN
jgi:hypothetical protein